MTDLERHLAPSNSSVKMVLKRLDKLASDAILFVIDKDNRLIGSITDGDVRRGLIKGLGLDSGISEFIHKDTKYFIQGQFDLDQMKEWRSIELKVIPVLDSNSRVVDIVNLSNQQSLLPMDAVIMAGGEGRRLRPLTLDTPKPLLKVGGKPIVEYNIDRLQTFGIKNISISIRYLGQQLIDYFQDGKSRNLNISYIKEDEPLGTIGALSKIEKFNNNYVLVMNSDLLTNINFEDMFSELLARQADMIVATTPYEVNIPYGIIETTGDRIIGIKEKPTYTYYSNAGIYMFKTEYVDLIPRDRKFNATDLMEALYTSEKKVSHYPIVDYWLDIGKPYDFEKAQKDIQLIKF